MTITLINLKKTADLAYLDPKDAEALLHEANTVLGKIDTLHQVDVTHVEPLLHPVISHQILRLDQVSEPNYLESLANIAPQFMDGHYLVPRVIRGK